MFDDKEITGRFRSLLIEFLIFFQLHSDAAPRSRHEVVVKVESCAPL